MTGSGHSNCTGELPGDLINLVLIIKTLLGLITEGRGESSHPGQVLVAELTDCWLYRAGVPS